MRQKCEAVIIPSGYHYLTEKSC